MSVPIEVVQPGDRREFEAQVSLAVLGTDAMLRVLQDPDASDDAYDQAVRELARIWGDAERTRVGDRFRLRPDQCERCFRLDAMRGAKCRSCGFPD